MWKSFPQGILNYRPRLSRGKHGWTVASGPYELTRSRGRVSLSCRQRRLLPAVPHSSPNKVSYYNIPPTGDVTWIGGTANTTASSNVTFKFVQDRKHTLLDLRWRR